MLRSRVAAGAAKPGPRAGCRGWSFSRSPQDNTSHQPEGCREGRGLSRGGPPYRPLGNSTWKSAWQGQGNGPDLALPLIWGSSPRRGVSFLTCKMGSHHLVPSQSQRFGERSYINFFLNYSRFSSLYKIKE